MQSKVSALPMDSGFIPNPPGIKQITGLLIDGERADFERNSMGVWPILEDDDDRAITSKSLAANLIATDPKNLSIILADDESTSVNVNGLKCLSVYLAEYNTSTKTGTFAVKPEDVATFPSSVAGYVIEILDEIITINSSSAPDVSGIVTFVSVSAGSNDISSPLGYVNLIGFLDGQFDGWSAVAGKNQIELFESVWVKPSYGLSWSTASEFKASRKIIGQTFAQTSGYIFTSNVQITGYSTIERPKTLTETINLDDCYNQLLVDGLYMMAERDSDASSSEALARTQIFEQSLIAYRVDMTAAAKRSAPRKFASSPRLGAKNRGW